MSVACLPFNRFTQNTRSAWYLLVIRRITDLTPRCVVTLSVLWAQVGPIPNRSAIKSADTLTCRSWLTKVRRDGVSRWSNIGLACAMTLASFNRSAIWASDGSTESRSASSDSASTYSERLSKTVTVSNNCRFHGTGVQVGQWSKDWIECQLP